MAATTGTIDREPDIEKGNTFNPEIPETGVEADVILLGPHHVSSVAEFPRQGKHSIRIILMDEIPGEREVEHDLRSQKVQVAVELHTLNIKREKVFDI